MVGQWNKGLFIYLNVKTRSKQATGRHRACQSESFYQLFSALLFLFDLSHFRLDKGTTHARWRLQIYNATCLFHLTLQHSWLWQCIRYVIPREWSNIPLYYLIKATSEILGMQCLLRAFWAKLFFCAVDVNLPQGSLQLSFKHNKDLHCVISGGLENSNIPQTRGTK